MKTTSATIVIVLALFITAINVSSCKKENTNTFSCTNGIKDGDETGIDCGGSCNTCYVIGTADRIKTRTYVLATTPNDTIVENYSYDAQGRVTEITGNTSEQFFYGTNTVTEISAHTDTTIYNLSSQGIAISNKYIFMSGAVGSTATFTHDGEGQILSIKINQTLGDSLEISYTWTDGNIVGATLVKNGILDRTYSYTRMADKISTIGNINIGYAWLGKDPKNIVNTATVNGIVYQYSYEYDSLGRVHKANFPGDDIKAETFTYY